MGSGSITVAGWQREPALAKIVRAAFPSYRRKSITVEQRDSVHLHDLNWSGGTRSEYVAVTVDGRRVGDLSKWNMIWPGDNIAEGKTIPIPAGHVVVRGGYFCGKESLLTLTVNPGEINQVSSQAGWQAAVQAVIGGPDHD